MILAINNAKAGLEPNNTSEVKQLLSFSLTRFAAIITRVKVHFFDINGPKGGIGKRYRISKKLKTSGKIVVLDEGDHSFEALSICLDRLVAPSREKSKGGGIPPSTEKEAQQQGIIIIFREVDRV